MFSIFIKESFFTACIFTTLILSLISKIIICILYQNMIREADNMSITTNNLLKQCKSRFANCYKLNAGVPNIPVFVEKYLNRMKIGPIDFYILQNLSIQFILSSILFSGMAIAKTIINGHSLGEILPFYVVSFFSLYSYFSVSSFADIDGKRKILKVSLVDYLENHMIIRLESVEVNEKNAIISRKVEQEVGKKTAAAEFSFNQEQAKELEELLKEFFVT